MQESIVFLVRVQCRRKESSRSLSHFLARCNVVTLQRDYVRQADVAGAHSREPFSALITRPMRLPSTNPSNIFAHISERELRRPSVCRLSVTFVHPTQAIEIYVNVSTPFVRWPCADIQVKFCGDRPRGTPP